MRQWPRYDWATAWASMSAKAAQGLQRRADRIGRVVVGLHFYQTDPDFVRAFNGAEGVRFVVSTRGVFHPKVFMFSDGEGQWECIIGSANLTGGGLGANDEVAVLITHEDAGAEDAQAALLRAFSDYWAKGRTLTDDEVDAYEAMWRRHAPERHSLAGIFGPGRNDGGASAVSSGTLFKTWDAYLNEVLGESHHTAEGRLAVLREARGFFERWGSFGAMPTLERKRVAGTIVENPVPINWLWFGSMLAAGNFKNIVEQHPEGLSAALDAIPLDGEVTRSHYEEYLRRFRAAFDIHGGHGGGDAAIATGTRLLAMKRPDYFVCVDSKNQLELCRAFRVKRTIGLSEYWDSLCERIYQSAWWSAPEPEDATGSAVWRGRTALLDALFYDPTS